MRAWVTLAGALLVLAAGLAALAAVSRHVDESTPSMRVEVVTSGSIEDPAEVGVQWYTELEWRVLELERRVSELEARVPPPAPVVVLDAATTVPE